MQAAQVARLHQSRSFVRDRLPKAPALRWQTSRTLITTSYYDINATKWRRAQRFAAAAAASAQVPRPARPNRGAESWLPAASAECAGRSPGRAAAHGPRHGGRAEHVAGDLAFMRGRAAPVVAVFQEPGGLRLVQMGAGAGVFAQLGLEIRVDRSGLGETDQAVGEVRCLGTGGQPDGQPPGGEVIDDCAAVVGVGDAVGDETFVQGQVGKRPILGQPVGGPVGGPTPLSVSYISHAAFSISRHAGGLEIGTSPEGALTASG